jgi:hypothetical protein
MLLVLTLAALAAAAGLGAIAWRVVRDERARSQARVTALAAAIDGAPAGPDAVAGVQALFDADRRAKAPGAPLLRVVGGFVVAVLVIIAIALTNDRDTQPVAKPNAAQRQDPGLELLSMRHEREGETLTITGLVRNHGTTPAERITAVVFTFDRDGSFIASGRAPLDFNTLAPGDESPFRVAIPHVADVGRYRVSFRTEAGAVRHVDRRSVQASVN